MNNSKLVLPAQKSLSDLTIGYPWAWFAMNDGGGDGAGNANAIANDSRSTALVDLPMAASGATEWSTRPGFWTPDGSTQYFAQLRSADAAAIDSVFSVGEGACLIGCQIRIATDAARKALFHFGSAVTTSRYGIYVAKETNNKLLCQLRDDAGTASSTMLTASAIATDATLANNATFNAFIAIDNRAGVKTVTMYLADTASPNTIEDNGGGTIATLGTMTMNSGNGTPTLLIGRDGSSSPTYWNGNVRRLLFINYGTAGLPTDLASRVIPALSNNGMIPTWKAA